MGFVCKGRYVLAPADQSDAEKYIDLLTTCMAETYATIADPGFIARRHAHRAEAIADFKQDINHPGTRAFLAYEVPNWQPDTAPSCSVSTTINWAAPVGLALSSPGPFPWEEQMPVSPVQAGLQDLVQLYTLSKTHGTGLGQALFDAVLAPNEPAYLWYIKGNERAVKFYERNGFTVEGIFGTCGGSWGVPEGEPGQALETGRMFRGYWPN